MVAVAAVVGVEAEGGSLVVRDSAVRVDGGVGGWVCLEPRVVVGEVDVPVDTIGTHLQDAWVAVEGEVSAVGGVGRVDHGVVPNW